MKTFMAEDFLLNSQKAVELYEKYAKNLPIIDYHCHINPQEIYEDKHFDNIAQVMLGGKYVKDGKVYFAGDHYKWRLMRACGIDEDYILGDKDDYERFYAFCKTLEKCIGNPMVHWCQLELKKYFNCTLPMNTKNCKQIWEICNEKLKHDPKCTARGFIQVSNVKMIGTTDDPIDSLVYHQLMKDDPTLDVLVVPSFRPDKALNIQNTNFKDYIVSLGKVANVKIESVEGVIEALHIRLKHFVSLGCKASDHGLEAMPDVDYDLKKANEAFQKCMKGEMLYKEEIESYQMVVLVELGKLYHHYHIVQQYHYNAMRNTNQKMFEDYGVDTGYDAMDSHSCIHGLQKILSTLSYTNECPKTVLYSLNPSDMDCVAVLAGCFQTNHNEEVSRIQLGAAWWFNDTKDGMERHLDILARVGVLGNFIGMLTDSRSFLSYTRHEYFRRILCNKIGNWVENGEFYDDDQILKEIIEGICFYNANQYFEL